MTYKSIILKKMKCPLCGQPFKYDATSVIKSICPDCIAQNELDAECAIRCSICNELYVPEPGTDPICPDCFKDIHQANQPQTLI